MLLLALFIVLVFAQSLVSARLQRTLVTAPMVFTIAGFLISVILPDLLQGRLTQETFLVLAEVGLVLLLFTDASRTDLHILKNIRNLPVRLLSTGLLFTILLGGLVALVVFRKLSVWEAGILGAILAPTDAGLGQVIVNSPRVPVKIREALNVEAGLNDGLSVPFLLFFIALAIGKSGEAHSSLVRFIGEQLGYGTLIGLGIGLAGGWLLGFAHRRRWMAASWQQLGVVTLPLLCAMASEAAGASMFIAAFVAGMAAQAGFPQAGSHSVKFTEEWGQLFNLSVFFLFGMLVQRAWNEFSAPHLLYAVLSVTIVRMLPVAIALWGTRLSRPTVLFMGWFGPRGLASIVLGLVYLEQETHQPGEETIRLAVMITVMLSILAHGLSAMPGMKLYARKIRYLPADAPENESAAEEGSATLSAAP